MNKVLTFLSTLRIANLAMLALVQFIVSRYFVQDFSLTHYLFIATSTICIALGGYLLNDLQDIEIDRINNKLKAINESNKKTYQIASYSAFIIGLAFGFWASYLSVLSYFFAYLIATISLILYAHLFSKYKFIGNLIISFLIALAILLAFYLEVHHQEFNRKYYGFDELDMLIYAGIAFLLNWLRELIKDIEDIEGDKAKDRKSIPLMIGINATAFIVGIILVFFMATFAYLAVQNTMTMESLYLIGLIMNALFILGFLFRAKKTSDYHTTSALIKLLMFLGLLLPIFS